MKIDKIDNFQDFDDIDSEDMALQKTIALSIGYTKSILSSPTNVSQLRGIPKNKQVLPIISNTNKHHPMYPPKLTLEQFQKERLEDLRISRNHLYNINNPSIISKSLIWLYNIITNGYLSIREICKLSRISKVFSENMIKLLNEYPIKDIIIIYPSDFQYIILYNVPFSMFIIKNVEHIHFNYLCTQEDKNYVYRTKDGYFHIRDDKKSYFNDIIKKIPCLKDITISSHHLYDIRETFKAYKMYDINIKVIFYKHSKMEICYKKCDYIINTDENILFLKNNLDKLCSEKLLKSFEMLIF